MTNGAHIRDEELQLLAIGAMPESEAAALLAHASGCGECTRRLAEERGLAAMLAFAAPRETPPEAVKTALMARIRTEKEAEAAANRAPRTPAAAQSEGRPRGGWWQWLLVPVTAGLIVATGLLWREDQQLSERLDESNHRIASMQVEQQKAAALIDTLSAPETVSVKLAGTPETEKALAVVRYNPRRGVVLYTAELPPLPADKTYQMWLVPSNGAPISAGVFTPQAEEGRHLWQAEVPKDVAVKAFAVTIEPAGGVAQPTGPKVLIGAA